MGDLENNPLLELGSAFGKSAPILIHHLHGGLDAGHAGALVAQQLLASLPAQRVATFRSDELIDYRSRRPVMTLEDWSFTDVEIEEIALDLLRTDSGQPLLLLHGPEPDFRWEAFTAAVVDLIDVSGVEKTIGVSGIPAAVAHTFPSLVNAHSVRPELIPAQAVMLGSVRVPGTIGLFLETRLAQLGRSAVGYVASVPYYLAESEFSQAGAALLHQIGKQTGLSLPVGDLHASAVIESNKIAEQIEQSPEVASMIEKLEKQSENLVERGAVQLVPNTPPGEEMDLHLEQFLANAMLRRNWETISRQGKVSSPPSLLENKKRRRRRRPRHRAHPSEEEESES